MSDRTPEQEVESLERRAAEQGVTLSPETKERLQRKFQESADFQARQQPERTARPANEFPTASPTADGTPSGTSSPAVGEHGMDVRAEAGPEMKDRDLFTLRRAERAVETRSREDEAELRQRAERRLEGL
jgi:hypothetical protein